MKKLFAIFFTLSIIALLAACNNNQVQENIQQHLEKTVQIEADFESKQKEIAKLEKKDQEIYEELIQLGQGEEKKIASLTKEAISFLDKRKEYVEEEKTSIEASKNEFKKIKPLIEKVEQEDEKNKLNEIYQIMMDRYKLYEKVYQDYMDSLSLTKDLYAAFQEERANENEVYNVIEKVNESYEAVSKSYNDFNDSTAQFNTLKKEYYTTLD